MNLKYGYSVFHPGEISATNGFLKKFRFTEPKFNQHLVSAVMVTRGNLKFVSKSIYYFNLQYWKNKELIIVCDNVTNELKSIISKSKSNIKLVEAPKGLTLGDYRNISIANSNGQYICQWDDDDLYSPERISICMRALSDTNTDAVFLQQWWVWWPERSILFLSSVRPWEGSMLAKRSAIPIYPSLSRKEDTPVVDLMTMNLKTCILECPDIYCYVITGKNTWDVEHFEGMLKQATLILKGNEYKTALEQLTPHLKFDIDL